MKKNLFFVLLLMAGISLVCAGGARGNGSIVTIDRKLPPFERIHARERCNVNYYQSEDYRVVIRIDSNLEDDLEVLVRNDSLAIGPKPGLRVFNPTELSVDVYCPSLSGVSISGHVQFSGKDKINASDFALRISGSGKFEGDIECKSFSSTVSGSGLIKANIVCESFSLDVSGSGKTTLTGSCNNMDIAMSGSGDFDGSEFKTNNAAVRTSGSSVIQLWVLDYLQARMSGSGGLSYRGDPRIDFNTSGSAHLQKIW